jgi:hypothetical protein
VFRVHDAAGEPITATFDVEAEHGSLSLILHSAGGGASRRLGGIPRAVRVPVGRRWMRSCARAHARSKPANQAKRCTIHQTSQPEGESPA